MEECTKEIIKKGGETADEKDQSSEAKITRKAQAGGMHHKYKINQILTLLKITFFDAMPS